MVEFLIDDIYVEFSGHILYQQTVGIPMGTNCVPLVADVFFYSYEADVVQHSMIIVMLFIQRNLRLKTRQMLQIG